MGEKSGKIRKEQKTKKIFQHKKVKKIEKNLFKLKKYHDYDDIEYRGIRDIKNLFDLSTDEDYCKPIKTNDTFNVNYIEYERKGDKNNTLSIKEYLNLIRPYLRDIINDQKTQENGKFIQVMK